VNRNASEIKKQREIYFFSSKNAVGNEIATLAARVV
jgi:hypothetical protein